VLLKWDARISIGNYQYFGIFGTIFWTMKNLIVISDRAHRFELETRMERLEQVARRIDAEITRIECQLQGWPEATNIGGCSEFFGEYWNFGGGCK
jgi:hypothetical protein